MNESSKPHRRPIYRKYFRWQPFEVSTSGTELVVFDTATAEASWTLCRPSRRIAPWPWRAGCPRLGVQEPRRVRPHVGASKLHHVADTVAALDIELTDQEITALQEHYSPRTLCGTAPGERRRPSGAGPSNQGRHT